MVEDHKLAPPPEDDMRQVAGHRRERPDRKALRQPHHVVAQLSPPPVRGIEHPHKKLARQQSREQVAPHLPYAERGRHQRLYRQTERQSNYSADRSSGDERRPRIAHPGPRGPQDNSCNLEDQSQLKNEISHHGDPVSQRIALSLAIAKDQEKRDADQPLIPDQTRKNGRLRPPDL